MRTTRLLALSGSLRYASYNTAALEALQRLAPNSVQITVFPLGDLPLFNPDRESEEIPALEALKSAVDTADGLIIASPEYAHGVTGPMKNALDWLVSGAEFPGIPVMLINTSPRAYYAQASLREILTTMSANLIEKAQVSIPLLGSELDVGGIVADSDISAALLRGLNAFCDGIARLGDRESR